MKFIKNCSSQIDWDLAISKCLNGHPIRYNLNNFPDTPQFRELNDSWQQAGYQYDDPTIEWINYFVDEFGQDVVDEFAKIGLDTARSILKQDVADLARRTDLEIETIQEVMNILKEEFED